jgi:hypothetical protein
MPQEPYFFLKELALLPIELWTAFSELLEHLPQVEQVLLECAANHDQAIQVHKM